MKRTLLIAAVLLLMVGCAATPKAPLAGPSTVSGAPTPTPTTPDPVVSWTYTASTPEASAPPVSALVLSPDGIGPLVMGMAPPTGDPAHDLLVFNPTACQWAIDEGNVRDTAGMWVANYEPAFHGKDASPFGVWVEDGKLESLAIYDSSLETAEGVHLQSTAAEVAAAYGDRLELVPEYEEGDSHMYRVTGTMGDLFIDVLKAESVAIYPEIGGEVVVRLNVAVKGDGPPGFNSDYGLGLCVGA